MLKQEKSYLPIDLSDLAIYLKNANDKVSSKKQHLIFNQKASTVIGKQKENPSYIYNLFKIVSRYYNIKAIEGYKKTSELIVLSTEKTEEKIHLAAYSYLGNYYGDRLSDNKMERIVFENEELTIQKEKLTVQNKNIIIWFGIIFIVLLLLVIRYQQKNNRNKDFKLREVQRQADEEIYNLLLSQQDKIEKERQSEKKRIAQELHDGILGRLFEIRLNLDSLNQREGEEAIKNRNTYINELKNIEQDIQEISYDFSKEKTMITNNFVTVVRNLIEKQQNLGIGKINCYIDDTIQWENIESIIKINLYRIIQESFHNSTKYARAKNISISILKISPQIVRLVLTDDGVGFDTIKAKKGIGLKSIQSRIQDMSGTLKLTSSEKKGTKIEVFITLKQSKI